MQSARQTKDELRLPADDALYRAAFLHAPTAMALLDLRGKFLHANAAMCELLGYGENELISLDVTAIAHPRDAERSSELLHCCNLNELRSTQIRQRFLHKSGREIFGVLSLARAYDADGNATHFIAHLEDETDRHAADLLEEDRRLTLELIAQDRPLPSVFDQLVQLMERQMPGMWPCLMLLYEGAMRQYQLSVPPVLAGAIKRRPLTFTAELTARREEPMTCVRVADVETDPAWEGLRDDARSLGVKCCWGFPVTGSDGSALGLLVIFSKDQQIPDSNQRSVLETTARLMTIGVEHHLTTRQLAHLVRHDALTGLPNRIMFDDRLHQALALARRTNKPLALLAMDLNRFKQINDTLGHHAGDVLLQQFAQRVRSRLRATDTLARVGGDEFLLLLPEVTSRDDAEMVAHRVTQGLASAQFELAGRSMDITSSIGVALFPADGDDTILLQRAADAAMYRAKELSRRSETAVALARSA